MISYRADSLLCLTSILAAALALAAIVGGGSCARADGQVLAAWEFNRAGDVEGWKDYQHMRDISVADGCLNMTVTDWDPFIIHEVFAQPIATSPTQAIKVRLNAPVAGGAEFFWTNTTESEFGGFSPGKETPFQVEPGWHEYTLRPFWQAEGQIIMMRFDLPGTKKGAEPDRTYQIDYLRVVNLGAAGEPAAADFSFDRGAQGFRVEGKGSARVEDGWLVADLEPGDMLVAPPVAIPAQENSFLGFVMAAGAGGSARLHWATEKTNGLHNIDVPLLADGKPHVYNVAVAANSGWSDKVIYLAIEPAQGVKATVRIKWLRASLEPTGPAEIDVRRLFISDPLPRAGRPTTIVAQIANRGGELLKGLKAELVLPAGAKLAPGEQSVKAVPDLDYYQPEQVSWRVVAGKAGEMPLRVKFSGAATAEAQATDRLLASLNLPRATYVPEPKPVRGAYDVGIYYFPGWATWGSWQPISNFPERKPVLGWYREGLPEVVDWHIKWAVEHGATFFCYDWYWNKGAQSLSHGLDGYFKARYRNLLKFCLLWANHDPTRHSPEDNAAVCKYWIDNYFFRPEYYKLGGRPLVVIFAVGAMQRDLGVEGSKAAIDLWHKMTREAGVGEVMIAGCGGPGSVQLMQQMGFDAVTGYNWPSCGAEGRNYVPYVEVAKKQFDLWWMPLAKPKLMPVIVPTSPGWDNRPWSGNTALVLTDRTPEAFEEHLRLARRFIDETEQPKVALIEAWNEFGEGSYCEPHREFGFGHLDAVRRVFCPDAPAHTDYGPADVGLGPYDVTIPASGRATWEFDKEGDGEGWGPMMGLSDFKVTDGAMWATSTSGDPAFSTGCRLRARNFAAVEVRMSITGPLVPDDQVQLFWSTPMMGTNEPASERVKLVGDGEMHVYRFEVGKNRLWQGLITGFRLDPGSTQGAHIKIDYIRAVP
jgi:hypothetical protein